MTEPEPKTLADDDLQTPPRQVPPDYLKMCSVWYMWAFIWYAITVVLGVTGVASSVTIAWLSSSEGNANPNVSILALVTALSTGLLAFFRAPQSYQAFFQAFRGLNIAIVNYRNRKSGTIAQLQAALEAGESIIAKSGQ